MKSPPLERGGESPLPLLETKGGEWGDFTLGRKRELGDFTLGVFGQKGEGEGGYPPLSKR